MEPPVLGSGDESENTLMRVLTGILEDSVQSLQRIEKAVNESTKIARSMLEKIDLIDKKIESGFVAVVKKALPALEQKFSDEIDKVGSLGEMTSLLPDIITKLQQSMQMLTIQNLLDELDQAPSKEKKEKPEKETNKEESAKEKEKPAAPKMPAASSPQEAVSQIQEAAKKEEKDKGEDHLLRPSSFFGS
jgi:hypothetical protein